jgi:hypothetical protein
MTDPVDSVTGQGLGFDWYSPINGPWRQRRNELRLYRSINGYSRPEATLKFLQVTVGWLLRASLRHAEPVGVRTVEEVDIGIADRMVHVAGIIRRSDKAWSFKLGATWSTSRTCACPQEVSEDRSRHEVLRTIPGVRGGGRYDSNPAAPLSPNLNACPSASYVRLTKSA